MTTNIYVANLAFATTSADLQSLFGEHGEVTKAQVVTDRDTGQSRGFGLSRWHRLRRPRRRSRL
jgi:RNA recognition motif-containing protein